ncbi:hypothetical protein [Streptomyces alanosinicus]|nr:hypothetical protein [Streptomyces alanosinicus]
MAHPRRDSHPACVITAAVDAHQRFPETSGEFFCHDRTFRATVVPE